VFVGSGKRGAPNFQEPNAAAYAPSNGFLWSAADNDSQAAAVNEAGRVVGYYSTATSVKKAFIQMSSAQGDTRVALSSSTGSSPAWATAINNAANVSIVGSYQDYNSWSTYGAVWKQVAGTDGTHPTDYVRTDAPLLNLNGYDEDVYLRGINDAGKVVGNSPNYTGDSMKAVLWDGSSPTLTVLETTFPANATAFGINNTDLIVGAATNPDGIDHAVVWKGDTPTMLDLNDYLSAYIGDGNTFDTLSQAWAVNDYNGGAVVGYGIRDGHVRAFIATPEPATWVMLIAGLGAAALLGTRAKRK
jgi:hypothetical protein